MLLGSLLFVQLFGFSLFFCVSVILPFCPFVVVIVVLSFGPFFPCHTRTLW